MMIKALSITALALITPTVGSADMLHPDDAADVRLLSGWRMENGNHMAALQVTLEPGWKTYWRAPGDGGIPPEFDWSGSRNMGVVDFHWPTPEVMDAGGMTTIGYRHELVLPFEVTPSDIGEDVTLDADLLLGICKDICVPVSRPLSADLSAAATEPDMAILRALDSRPDTVEEAAVASVSCTLSTLSDGMRVTASLDLPRVGPDEIVVFEIDDPSVWVSDAMGNRVPDGPLEVYADFVPPDGQPFGVAAQDIRLTVLGGGRAVDVPGCDTMVED